MMNRLKMWIAIPLLLMAGLLTRSGLGQACQVSNGVSGGTITAAPVTLLNQGDDSHRVQLVFLGDGYAGDPASQQKYQNDVNTIVAGFFNANAVSSPPYSTYSKYFNIYRIDVQSTQSGATHYDGLPNVNANRLYLNPWR